MAMEPIKIDLTKLRNPEYAHYISGYLRFLEHNDLALLKVGTEHAALRSIYEQISDVLHQDYSSPISPIIQALDLQRGQILGALYATISGLCGHYNMAKKTAAIALKDRMYVYGTARKIRVESRSGRSAIIQNLVDDLQDIPLLSTALTTLDLSDWVAHLAAVNADFNAQYMARTVEIAAMNPDRIKRLRLDGNEAFYQLREMLMAQGLVAAYAPPFSKAIQEVNALTEQYNATLAQRAGFAAQDDEDGSPLDTERSSPTPDGSET